MLVTEMSATSRVGGGLSISAGHLALTHDPLETQVGVRIGRASSVHRLRSCG